MKDRNAVLAAGRKFKWVFQIIIIFDIVIGKGVKYLLFTVRLTSKGFTVRLLGVISPAPFNWSARP